MRKFTPTGKKAAAAKRVGCNDRRPKAATGRAVLELLADQDRCPADLPEEARAVNKPVGNDARKGAVRERSQLKTKTMGKKHWTKRSKESGEFMAQKKEGKFKGVRRER